MFIFKDSCKLFLVIFLIVPSLCFAQRFDLRRFQDLKAAGKLNEAVVELDKGIGENDANPDLYFHKGVILSQLLRDSEAIAAFQRCIELGPNLAEPYNNLGVLLAYQGRLTEARAAFEKAIELVPDYVVALENSADIHIRVAATAYRKALMVGSTNMKVVKDKLARIDNVLGGRTEPSALASEAAKSISAQLPEKTVAIAATTAAVDSAMAKQALTATATGDLSLPSTADGANSTELEGSVNNRAQEIKLVLQQWANHWSKGDFSAYVASYSGDFKPSNMLNRSVWLSQRKRRLTINRNIRVTLDAFKFAFDDGVVNVQLRQLYKSDQHSSTDNKFIQLRFIGGRWLITKEEVL